MDPTAKASRVQRLVGRRQAFKQRTDHISSAAGVDQPRD